MKFWKGFVRLIFLLLSKLFADSLYGGLPSAGQTLIAQQVKNSMFCECNDLVPAELVTKQNFQILRASISVQTFGLREKWIIFMLLQCFQGNQCSVWYLNAGKFVQRVVQSSQRRRSAFEKLGGPSTLEVLLVFHRHLFVDSCAWQESVRALGNIAAQSKTTIGVVNQMTVKAFRALCRHCPGWLTLYHIWRTIGTVCYIVFACEFFAAITQSEWLEEATSPLPAPNGLESEAYGRTSDQHIEFRYIIHVLLDMLHHAIWNNVL